MSLKKDKIVEIAYQMYYELQENHLEVILIPAPDQKHSNHKIRVAISKNPDWYGKLYHKVCDSYKHKGSGSVRKSVERALIRIVCGKQNLKYRCDDLLMEIIWIIMKKT